jgi:hypothetical protein
MAADVQAALLPVRSCLFVARQDGSLQQALHCMAVFLGASSCLVACPCAIPSIVPYTPPVVWPDSAGMLCSVLGAGLAPYLLACVQDGCAWCYCTSWCGLFYLCACVCNCMCVWVCFVPTLLQALVLSACLQARSVWTRMEVQQGDLDCWNCSCFCCSMMVQTWW